MKDAYEFSRVTAFDVKDFLVNVLGSGFLGSHDFFKMWMNLIGHNFLSTQFYLHFENTFQLSLLFPYNFTGHVCYSHQSVLVQHAHAMHIY